MKVKKNTTKLPNSSAKLPFKIIFYDADKKLPKVHSARWHAKRHSNRVLVLVAFAYGPERGRTYEYRMGCWLKDYEWQVEGMSGRIHVAAWGYMPNKMKQFFNSK